MSGALKAANRTVRKEWAVERNNLKQSELEETTYRQRKRCASPIWLILIMTTCIYHNKNLYFYSQIPGENRGNRKSGTIRDKQREDTRTRKREENDRDSDGLPRCRLDTGEVVGSKPSRI